MEVVKESSPSRGLQYGHTVVGVTPVKLCEGFRTNRSILLRCPGSSDPVPNTALVWVGDSRVTAGKGFPLPPGQAMVIPIDDPGLIYIVSTAADQDVAWIGV